MSRRATDRIKLEIDISARSGAEYAPALKKRLFEAHALMRTHVRSLSVALVGDALIARLHQRFMRIAGPTDVLTFELEHDAKGRVTAGEVVICVPFARRQAAREGTSVENELLLYAVHGLLHLSGYDDLAEPDYRAMHREEDRILTAMKIGPVFEPTAKPTVRRRKKDGRVR